VAVRFLPGRRAGVQVADEPARRSHQHRALSALRFSAAPGAAGETPAAVPPGGCSCPSWHGGRCSACSSRPPSSTSPAATASTATWYATPLAPGSAPATHPHRVAGKALRRLFPTRADVPRPLRHPDREPVHGLSQGRAPEPATGQRGATRHRLDPGGFLPLPGEDPGARPLELPAPGAIELPCAGAGLVQSAGGEFSSWRWNLATFPIPPATRDYGASLVSQTMLFLLIGYFHGSDPLARGSSSLVRAALRASLLPPGRAAPVLPGLRLRGAAGRAASESRCATHGRTAMAAASGTGIDRAGWAKRSVPVRSPQSHNLAIYARFLTCKNPPADM